MTPAYTAVYEELLSRAASPPHHARSHALREAFLERCGRFEPVHELAETRERAAWEDALVQGGLAAAIGEELADPAERELCRSFKQAHRGIFAFEQLAATPMCRDLWSRAEFVLFPGDDVVRELRATFSRGSCPLWQARLVATNAGCIVLPGLIFHPMGAQPAIEQTLELARGRGLSQNQVLDALLLMERTFRVLSRVKIAYAYRPEALPR